MSPHPWPIRARALGTVTLVDDLGTVHVRWDDGGTLGLVPDEDEWLVLAPAATES